MNNINIQTISKKTALTAMVGLAILAGVVGGSVLKIAQTNAQTTQPTTTTAPATTGSSPTETAPSGKFKSNENPAHEAGENAAREAQEDAGQMPTGK